MLQFGALCPTETSYDTVLMPAHAVLSVAMYRQPFAGGDAMQNIWFRMSSYKRLNLAKAVKIAKNMLHYYRGGRRVLTLRAAGRCQTNQDATPMDG